MRAWPHRPSAGTSRPACCPPHPAAPTAIATYGELDLARLRLLLSLRRLGLSPEDAGRLAASCVVHDGAALDLAPLIAEQRAAVARQREDLDRLDAELTDLELTIDAATRRGTTPEERSMSDQPIRVLFVCTGNSARSQIAEALLERFGGADFAVESAGTDPKGVNPFAIQVLAEVGIDWTVGHEQGARRVPGPAVRLRDHGLRPRQAGMPGVPGLGQHAALGPGGPGRGRGHRRERLAAFRRTRQELTLRLRPFIEIARRTAGLPVGPSIAG